MTSRPRIADDEHWMRQAILEARQCLNRQSQIYNRQSDVPVGAVCVRQGQIIGRGHNRREAEGDATAHAEVLAIRQACQEVGNWRLDGVTLYVSLEPCPMCAGAILLSRLDRLVFGAWEPKTGACGSLFDIVRHPRLTSCPQVKGGVLHDECAALLEEFFASRRTAS